MERGLPWQLDADGNITSADGSPVHTAHYLDGGLLDSEKPFVVRAVNAHSALVAALEACRNEGLPSWLEDKVDAALAIVRS